MSKPRLVYAWPTAGYPKPAFVNSLSNIRCRQSLADHQPHDVMCASAPVQMARTQLCVEALGGGYDFMVMHDDDLDLGNCDAGNPIDNSIDIMLTNPDVGIVGAVYMREKPLIPTFTMYHPEYGAEEHCAGIGGIPPVPFDVGGVGFGWVMIRMEVVRKLAELNDGPIIRFAKKADVAGIVREIGEDYDFCDRTHELGYRVIADPRYKTEHHKRTGILTYQHDKWEAKFASPDDPIQIEAHAGSKLIEINGITCLDVSGSRFAEAKALDEKGGLKPAKASEKTGDADTSPVVMAPAKQDEPRAEV